MKFMILSDILYIFKLYYLRLQNYIISLIVVNPGNEFPPGFGFFENVHVDI